MQSCKKGSQPDREASLINYIAAHKWLIEDLTYDTSENLNDIPVFDSLGTVCNDAHFITFSKNGMGNEQSVGSPCFADFSDSFSYNIENVRNDIYLEIPGLRNMPSSSGNYVGQIRADSNIGFYYFRADNSMGFFTLVRER